MRRSDASDPVRVQQLIPSVDATAVTRLVVVDKRDVGDGVVAVTMADASGRRLPSWAPGAHVDVVLPSGLTRQYSLCGDRFDPLTYRIGVLREEASRGGSAWIHDSLQPGDALGVGAPRNNFGLVPARRYAFVAGGIGITPLLPMVAQADALGIDWNLWYGGRTRRSMGFLDELAAYGDRVTVRPQDECGLLDLEEALAGADPGGSKVYACGPAGLLSALDRLCAGEPTGFLRTERFVSTESRDSRAEPFTVRMARSGREITVPADVTILDALGRIGVTVVSSCHQGLCGTCEVPVLSGEVDHRDSLLDEAERAANDCLFVCVSRALDDHLVLDV